MSGWVKMNPADFGDGDKGDLWLTHPKLGGRRVPQCVFVEDHGPGRFTGWLYGEGHYNEGYTVGWAGWTITHWMPEPDAPEGAK